MHCDDEYRGEFAKTYDKDIKFPPECRFWSLYVMLEKIKRFLSGKRQSANMGNLSRENLLSNFNEIHYQIHYSKKHLLVAGLRIIRGCISGGKFV